MALDHEKIAYGAVDAGLRKLEKGKFVGCSTDNLSTIVRVVSKYKGGGRYSQTEARSILGAVTDRLREVGGYDIPLDTMAAVITGFLEPWNKTVVPTTNLRTIGAFSTF